MTTKNANILAGVEAGGTGGSLSWFGPLGTAGPASATDALNAAFLDGGWVHSDGLAAKVAESNNDITAYGTIVPVRTLTTSSKRTFTLTFLESNQVAVAVYNRLALNAITVDPTDGSFSFETGAPSAQQYSAVFDIIDGANHLRAYCPIVQNTAPGDLAVKAGEAIAYPVELTAFPDAAGNAIYWHYLVDALKSG
jgi:hypothetical protein